MFLGLGWSPASLVKRAARRVTASAMPSAARRAGAIVARGAKQKRMPQRALHTRTWGPQLVGMGDLPGTFHTVFGDGETLGPVYDPTALVADALSRGAAVPAQTFVDAQQVAKNAKVVAADKGGLLKTVGLAAAGLGVLALLVKGRKGRR